MSTCFPANPRTSIRITCQKRQLHRVRIHSDNPNLEMNEEMHDRRYDTVIKAIEDGNGGISLILTIQFVQDQKLL